MKTVHLFFEDYSKANGPGVNEREFVLAASKDVENFYALAPRPRGKVDDLSSLHSVRFAGLAARYLPMRIVWNQMTVAIAAWELAKTFEKENAKYRFVVRLPLLPWSVLFLILFFDRTPFFVKSLGDTEFLRRQNGARRYLSYPLLWLQTSLVGAVLNRCKAIDTVTRELAAIHSKRYGIDPSKLAVIPNATNVKRFVRGESLKQRDRYLISDEDTVVCYVGGKPFERGGAIIINAIERLKVELPNLKCVIAGGDADKLLKLSESLGVTERCRVIGRIPYDDVPILLNSVDILLATDDVTRVRAFGNSNQKIRQALAVGVPVISNQFVESEFLDEKLVIGVDTDNIEQVVSAIMALVRRNEEEVKAFRMKSRRFIAANYSMASVMGKRLAIWGGSN